VLEELVRFFGCGRVRPKGPASSVLTYSVHSLQELAASVIPFFERERLVIKQRDFERFADIVSAMRRKEHLRPEGFERLVSLAYAMNAHGKQRARSLEQVLSGSSETARQASFDLPVE
jgi:ubiquinone biosynthesis protein UbiJ